MSNKNKKIDFNNPGDLGDIVNSMASAKTGKKINVNMKFVGIATGYFLLSGLIANGYGIVKLILMLF